MPPRPRLLAAAATAALCLCLSSSSNFAAAQEANPTPAPSPPPPQRVTPPILASVVASSAASTASLLPCVWSDFVSTLERAAAEGSYVFAESGDCDEWTSATLLEAFGGDREALEAAGYDNGAAPPRELPLTELQAYRLRVSSIPSGSVLALSPTVTAVAVAPRGPGNQGWIVRAFRRFARLSQGDVAGAERIAAGRNFDARVTFIPAPFPLLNPEGNATYSRAARNEFRAGKLVVFTAESPQEAASARAASPAVAEPKVLTAATAKTAKTTTTATTTKAAAAASTPYLDALLASSPSSSSSNSSTSVPPQEKYLDYWATEDVINAWVGPWKG